MISLNRRNFLKLSSLVSGGLLFFRPKATAGLYTPHVRKPKGKIKYYPNICSYCSTGCDIVVRARVNGKFKKPLKIDGNTRSTYNRGKICARGQAGVMTVYNPDRITTPLIRVKGSKRGEWKFRKATWEEAYNYIKDKIKEYNIQPHEVALFNGQRACAYERLNVFALSASIGCPNIIGSPMQQCVMTEHAGAAFTVGSFASHDEILVDIENAKVMLAVGTNAAVAGISVPRAVRFAKGKLNGLRVISLDPRQSELSSKADKWLPVKPGTNLPFLMSMIHILIKNGWYEDEFLRRHTTAPFLIFDNNGTPEAFGQNTNPHEFPFSKAYYVYDEISDSVVEVDGFTNDNVGNRKIKPALFAPKGLTFQGKPAKTAFDYLWGVVKNATPQWAAKICDVPVKDIEEAGWMMGNIRPATVHPGWMDGRYDNVVQARKAAAIVNVLVGGVDRPGGWIFRPANREGTKRFVEAYKSGKLSNPMVLMMNVAMAPGLLGVIGKIEGMIYSDQFPLFRGWPHFTAAYNKYREEHGEKALPYAMFTTAGFREGVEGKLSWKGKPYNIKMAFIYSTNPLKDYYGYRQWVDVFTNPNLKLIVACDILPSDITTYSDVILPDKTYLEKFSQVMDDGSNSDFGIRMRFPSVSHVGEAKGGGEVATIISNALNGSYQSAAMVIHMFTGWDMNLSMEKLREAWLGKIEFFQALNDISIAFYAKMLNMKPETLKKKLEEKGVLYLRRMDELLKEEGMPWKMPTSTFTGRVEIYSVVLSHFNHRYGVDPAWNPILTYMPITYRKGAPQDFLPKDDDEFFFTFGKVPEETYLTTADNPMLNSLVTRHSEENFGFWMHPKRADKLGLKEGDRIEVMNTVSGQKIESFVHITELVRPDTVYVMSNFGLDNKKLTFAHGKGVDLSKIITYREGPVTAAAMSCQFTVRVRKI